ncbi:MAG: hypothetical protein EOO28_32295 [Comamonadaceae bacterium]|nr:MAG: hypothetical protein EOO28_32295 [Comamonadaceae bacterium]
MTPCNPFQTTRRQRGSVVISSAIALSALVIVLLGAELGHLFYMKREYQKAVDLAAMAGAQALRPGDGCGPATTAALANAAANLPSGVSGAVVSCRHWDPVKYPVSPHLADAAGGERLNAVLVRLSHSPSLLMPGIPGNALRNVEVNATAAQRHPLAALTIQNTLLTVDTGNSPLLNTVVGGLLGGSLNVSVAGWQGLVGTNVQLLSYLDELAVVLNVGAGDYDELLTTNATAGQLLTALATVLQKNGTAQAAVQALGLIEVAANAGSNGNLKIGELLGLQTGTPTEGMKLDLNAFRLVEGIVQLANGQNAAVATVPVSVPGIGSVTVKLKVIEKPRLSGIGDPELAALDPDGPNAIYARTAQVRALATINLPLLSAISGLTNLVGQLLAPVTTLLNNVLTLNLKSILESLVCASCTQTRALLAPDTPLRLSLLLDAPSSSASVTDVDCSSATNRELDVRMKTSLATLRVGQLTAAQELAALGSGLPPTVAPIPVLDTQTRTCTTIVVSICDDWKTDYRTGLKVDSTVAATQATRTYVNPPEIDQPPAFQTITVSNIVNSLKQTFTGLQLQTYKYSATGTSHFGALVGTATSLVTTAVTAVGTLLSGLLSPLLDPLVNALLTGLGINLGQAQVGAQLSCTRGVELVF